MRLIPPVRSKLPKIELPEPVRKSLKPLPPLKGPVPVPSMSTAVKRGEYLVRMGECNGCHTPVDKTGRPIQTLDLAGGYVLKGPWGEVAAANITPDASGISYYTEAMFLQVMKAGHIRARKINPVMLWGYFRKMTDDDLKAMFAYLRTVPPIKHRVDNTEAVGLCRLCGQRHGLGAAN